MSFKENPPETKDEPVYNKLLELSSRDLSLLFQRLNFFFIGTAFLITGLAILVANGDGELSGKPLILAYLITMVGFYLATFFTYINFLNVRIIWNIGDYIRRLEKGIEEKQNGTGALTKIEDVVAKKVWRDEFYNNHFVLFWRMIVEICNFFFNPSKASTESFAPHTYIIPLGFSIFWIIVFFSVLPDLYRVIFFIPLIIIIILLLGNLLNLFFENT